MLGASNTLARLYLKILSSNEAPALSQEPKGQPNLSQPQSSGTPLQANAVRGKASGSGAAPVHTKHDELRLLVNSRHPIITVETPEEERFEQLLLEVAVELGVPMYEWSVTAGLAKCNGAITGVSEGTKT